MRTRSKVLLAAAATVGVVLGGAGTAYAAHFQDRALPGSALSGVSVAGMTRDEVTAQVQQRTSAVSVTLEAGGSTSTESLADLGYAVDVEATVDAVFAANERWSSFATSLVSARDVDAVVRADQVVTDAVVADLVTRSGKVGADAGVTLASDKKSFVVTPAVPGYSVDRDSLSDAVAAAARDLTSTTVTVEFVEGVPAVTTADAERVADQANALVARTVKVSDGDDTHAASAATKASWVAIPVEDGVLGTPSITAEKVQAWVDKVAKKAKVDARSGTRNVSVSGTVVRVVEQARDGKVVTNHADVAKALVQSLTGGRDFKGSFEYRTIAATWTERKVADGAENLAYPAAPGEKWIDVNLGRNTMTAYVGGKVVKGPISMVHGAAETPTVVGTFRVYYKNPLMTMRGNNADGTKYETPDVPWSTFFHRGYALHGAPWRSSFGYTGSHGCINLPVDVAKWIYDFAPIGTPVVTHY